MKISARRRWVKRLQMHSKLFKKAEMNLRYNEKVEANDNFYDQVALQSYTYHLSMLRRCEQRLHGVAICQ